MGLQKWFSRVLMSTWFREITVIDIENIPKDRGSVIVSWHPGGLFDKMLTKGLLPVQQIGYGGLVNDENELENLSSQIAAGKSIVVFPKGEELDSSDTKQIQDNAAEIALRAYEIAEENKPVIIPVGIHYSKKNYFRERVALSVERPIEITGSKNKLSEIISGEISRASLSREDWKDRELIWKARSIIEAERRRKNPELEKIVTYGQGVLGARRVRAAWEWLAQNDSKECAKLEYRTKEHMSKLEKLDLKPHHVDSRPMSVTTKGFAKSIFFFLFAWSFMVGFVTFSAIVGSFPPFLFVALLDRTVGRKLIETSRGALKLYTALIVYPIWWFLSASAFTWALLSDSSPLSSYADYSIIIEFLFALPAALVLPLMLWWMPTAGKLQVKLYAKGKSSWRRMRLWAKWRNSSFDWDNLCAIQKDLASDLVRIGDGLILPGDDDWNDPAPGKDDYTVVQRR